MKVKLNVMERLVLHSLLPEKGSFATLRSIQNAKQNILLTDEEVKEFGFKVEKQENGTERALWNEAGQAEKEIEIGDVAFEEIKTNLKTISENKGLIPNQMSLYEKFVGNS